MSDELAFLDATAQAELVRRGELSPSALVEDGHGPSLVRRGRVLQRIVSVRYG